MFTTVKTAGRAAALALVVSASVLTAMPAQAAMHYMSPGMSMGMGMGMGMGTGLYPHRFNSLFCYSDYQVRQALKYRGFSHIYLNAAMGRFIQARATRGNWVYLIEFNRCSGHIVDLRRLRRAY